MAASCGFSGHNGYSVTGISNPRYTRVVLVHAVLGNVKFIRCHHGLEPFLLDDGLELGPNWNSLTPYLKLRCRSSTVGAFNAAIGSLKPARGLTCPGT